MVILLSNLLNINSVETIKKYFCSRRQRLCSFGDLVLYYVNTNWVVIINIFHNILIMYNILYYRVIWTTKSIQITWYIIFECTRHFSMLNAFFFNRALTCDFGNRTLAVLLYLVEKSLTGLSPVGMTFYCFYVLSSIFIIYILCIIINVKHCYV